MGTQTESFATAGPRGPSPRRHMDVWSLRANDRIHQHSPPWSPSPVHASPPRRLGDLCIHPLTCTYPGCPQPQPMAAPSKTHRFHLLGWAVRPMGTHWRSRLRIGHGKGVREQGTEPGTLACISHHLTAGRAAQGWPARFNGLPSPSWGCPGCSTCVAVHPLVAFVA